MWVRPYLCDEMTVDIRIQLLAADCTCVPRGEPPRCCSSRKKFTPRSASRDDSGVLDREVADAPGRTRFFRASRPTTPGPELIRRMCERSRAPFGQSRPKDAADGRTCPISSSCFAREESLVLASNGLLLLFGGRVPGRAEEGPTWSGRCRR